MELDLTTIPQREAFLRSWLEIPFDIPLPEFGASGALSPVPEWAGDPRSQVLRLDGTLRTDSFSADFALFLSDVAIQHLLSTLPEPFKLDGVTKADGGLLFEHLLSALMDRFERGTGYTLSLNSGQLADLAKTSADGFAVLNAERGALPVALASDSQPFWDLLTDLNDRRIAGKIPRQLQITIGPVLVPAADVPTLAEGDVVVLEGARGNEFDGDLLIGGRPAFTLRVNPARAIIIARSGRPPVAPDPSTTALTLSLAMVSLTDDELAALHPGAELPYQRPADGTVDLLSDGRRVGTSTITLQDGVLAVKIREMAPQ